MRDFDGDGHTDLLVAAPQAFFLFPAAVLSGATGEVLRRVSLELPRDMGSWEDPWPSHLGLSACAVGDLDRDGLDDFALGGASVRCGTDCIGSVVVCSGKDAKPLRWFTRKSLAR